MSNICAALDVSLQEYNKVRVEWEFSAKFEKNVATQGFKYVVLRVEGLVRGLFEVLSITVNPNSNSNVAGFRFSRVREKIIINSLSNFGGASNLWVSSAYEGELKSAFELKEHVFVAPVAEKLKLDIAGAVDALNNFYGVDRNNIKIILSN